MVSTITSKGQVTIPKEFRDQLNLKPGDTVKWFVHPNGSIAIYSTVDVTVLRGCLKHEGPPLTLDQMDEAIAEGATRRHRRHTATKPKAA